MDAREALRRYLEQRRDMGERELTLDTLSVEQALALLGAPQGVRARRTAPAPADGPGAPLEWGKSSVPDTQPYEAAAERGPATGDAAPSDWREAIRAAGGAPDSASALRPATSAPSAPESRPERPAAPVADHPSGGASGRASPPPAAATAAPGGRTDGASPFDDVPGGLIVGASARGGDDARRALATLDAVADAIAACTRCPLYEAALNPVPGAGNPEAGLMIVGEAPGANEDEQGLPFVGASGQLLTKIIGAIGLTRDDVFIANVIKHRPPGNRNPTAAEVTACSPYLIRQIELVRPRVILALGTFAAQTLLETKITIGNLRGQVHRYHGVPLVVTYHPAALLRNPAWKRPTWEDVQLARRILDRAQPAQP
jgi:uracil-DNA glycosylase family 4